MVSGDDRVADVDHAVSVDVILTVAVVKGGAGIVSSENRIRDVDRAIAIHITQEEAERYAGRAETELTENIARVDGDVARLIGYAGQTDDHAVTAECYIAGGRTVGGCFSASDGLVEIQDDCVVACSIAARFN